MKVVKVTAKAQSFYNVKKALLIINTENYYTLPDYVREIEFFDLNGKQLISQMFGRYFKYSHKIILAVSNESFGKCVLNEDNHLVMR